MKNKLKGFTLIELMIFLAIVGVIVSVAIRENKGNEIICIDGVEYIYKESYSKELLSVKFNTDSQVILCEEK